MSIATPPAAEAPASPPIREAAALLAAMASPRRLTILCRLVEGEAGAAELAEITGLSPAGVASHLAQLRRLGLIAARRRGIAVFFSLASDEAKAVLETLHALYCAPARAISRAATAP
ncbi:DNA-binding transcriptional ArsR family regulator [Bosea sp. 62]|uniref:ArsR/SmtB family transcription factor n=1 Tax=unclassified Bosea (in: a-proteobacteria) TaxID=2653178 RepID=UPI00125769A7|nr:MULTISPECIES: metalloregulator ArsR/SmtB family transcription factor [unclassified Bosea (in: a-proteobacteria)]CAD5254713.1 DNA-binding transcriptional ArsR family regulator [Bosea sp. 7B]CAD5276225.1 DNA-binding transcriptional ArsR family regulator [Bosea sp. 21B]CAD5277395.1 DNA-binding transcriptional ArsR family regulator [Bosea sp. 46]VVT59904.1 DNA-binding transcriptional regulator, ArsR family [Bosea sp. EC-HK365B]VXB48053.1 DNA-binding transcriptional ArsR family regulator [Bosea 